MREEAEAELERAYSKKVQTAQVMSLTRAHTALGALLQERAFATKKLDGARHTLEFTLRCEPVPSGATEQQQGLIMLVNMLFRLRCAAGRNKMQKVDRLC